MQTTCSTQELADYTTKQLNLILPAKPAMTRRRVARMLVPALERVEHCFQRIADRRYSAGGQALFDPLHSDQYCHFLYFLSREAWRTAADEELAKRLFYLNKTLHGFNCMYDTELPEVFWLIHVVGAVLGKAHYGNYLVVRQNCTVGALRGEYPVFGEGVVLSAGASVIGRCRLGRNVMLGPGCTLVNTDVPDDTLVVQVEAFRQRPNSERALSTHFHL